jgi:heme exporter protein D
MSWHGIDDFLHMGGYGLYVWGSYAVTLGFLAVEALMLIARERGLTRRLRKGYGR